jgi:hypothetical protein
LILFKEEYWKSNAADGNMGKYQELIIHNARFAAYTDFDYTIAFGSQYVSYNADTHKFTGISSGTAVVQATNKTSGIVRYFNLKVNKNAIIIIPGIMGSELFVGDDNPNFEEHMPLFSKDIINGLSTYRDGKTIRDLIPSAWWQYVTNIPSVIRLYNAWSDAMSCNDDGTSKYDIYVKEYRSSDSSSREGNNCGIGNAYSTLYNELIAAYSDRYSVDFFSYDWRLSNSVSASKLDDYIEHYGYDKVVLVAHSMGGLVASGYLGRGSLQRDKVKKVIYLSSPLLGTPTIANVWYNEDISFVAFDNLGVSVEDFAGVYKLITGMMDPIQNLICNYVSIYELFPSKYYFQLTGSSYMSNSYTLVTIGGTNTVTECSTYTTTKEILTGYFDDFDSDLMALAEAFHDTTFISGNHVSAYVDASYWSCYTDSSDDATISHLKFYQVVSNTSYAAGLEVDGAVSTGDGLVLRESGTLAGRYSPKCYYLKGYHMSLVKDTQLFGQWIPNIS